MHRGAWWATAHGVTESDTTAHVCRLFCHYTSGSSLQSLFAYYIASTLKIKTRFFDPAFLPSHKLISFLSFCFKGKVVWYSDKSTRLRVRKWASVMKSW